MNGEDGDDWEHKYLEILQNPHSIILAVSAVNENIYKSKSLKMALKADPNRNRTIGVLTKADLLGDDSDCTNILANEINPLKHGYIAVIGRSQKDIRESISIRSGLLNEKEFFLSHSSSYKSYSSKCGTKNLTRILILILMRYIRDSLPDLKSKVLLNRFYWNCGLIDY